MTDSDKIQTLPLPFLERMKEMLGDDYDAFLESYENPRTWLLKIIKSCLVVRTSGGAAFLIIEVSGADPWDRPDWERGKRLKILAGELGGVYT